MDIEGWLGDFWVKEKFCLTFLDNKDMGSWAYDSMFIIWLKIQGFFQYCGGTWLEFLWGGGTKMELRFWAQIIIINQIPPGGGTENLKSRNLSR